MPSTVRTLRSFPARLIDLSTRHRLFLLILLLFIGFRVLALLLFRPGGYITDYSDYLFYWGFGRLAPQGYLPYDNLWTPYPPLFHTLLTAVFYWAAQIPPWVDPRLGFYSVLGLWLILFESGNLVAIYRISRTLHTSYQRPATSDQPYAALLPSLLYALFFAPVYTLLGWFEPMMIFFLLLGLDLLLRRRTYPAGWMVSAMLAALGFLTKLTPALLLPIAVRWLGARLSWSAARREWFNRLAAGNLLRPALYALIFLGTIVAVGYPLIRTNPALALVSFRVQTLRPPWQSLWALLDGYTGFGFVPLDNRNLAGLNNPGWDSALPWGWITLSFVLLYLWLYTRPYDWEQPRTPVAFAALSTIWLLLYNKGWSPQFLVWILPFVALLMPTLRGVAFALLLTAINVLESSIYLILLPDQVWILWGTVLARTALLLLLGMEFLGQIWPTVAAVRLRRSVAISSWTTMAVIITAAVIATPRIGHAYVERRLAEHSCREAIALLTEQAPWPTDLLVADRIETWETLYPWLHDRYELRVIDGYSPGRDPDEVRTERLAALVADHSSFWWLSMDDATLPAFVVQPGWQPIETHTLGACTLVRIVNEDNVLAVADVAGGPIELLDTEIANSPTDNSLHLVVYWRARTPVTAQYTVFTQLFDPAGQMVAQQDNPPGEGQMPTDAWQPEQIVRDPYRLTLTTPPQPGTYRLLIGLYNAEGRRPLTLADGTSGEFVDIPVQFVSE